MESLRESTIPSANSPSSFPALLYFSANRYGQQTAFSDDLNGHTRELSFVDCLLWSNAIARRLIALSVAPKCVVLSESRIEWPLAFFGILWAGGAVIPVDTRSSVRELATIFQTMAPAVILVSPKLLVVAEEAAAAACWQGEVLLMDLNDRDDVRAIASKGKTVINSSLPVGGDGDLAVIAFTAGTDANPKAVQLSFRSIFHQMQSLREGLSLKPGDALLSILPLNNLVEMTCNIMAAFSCGCHVHFPRSLIAKELKRAMRKYKITHLIAKPRILKFMEGLIRSQFMNRYGREGERRLSQLLINSHMTNNNMLRRHLSAGILNEIGPYLRRILVCESTLDNTTHRFFRLLGVDIQQSYGLVECGGIAAMSPHDHSRFGSAGIPLQGCAVRIQSAGMEKIGEILIRGPHLLRGYYAREDLFAIAIDDDGWLHTGDLGFLTHDGFLYVVGRHTSVISLDDGNRVYPGEVERALRDSCLFDDVFVIGLNRDASAEGAEQVCAVVVPKIGLQKLMSSPELQSLCETEVERKAGILSTYKRPQRVIVRTGTLPKTHTGSIRLSLLKNAL